MKTIRYLAALILLANGILHLFVYFQSAHNSGSTGYLIFGILYSLSGLLLFNSKKYSLYVGIIVPLIGMTLSFIKFGILEIISMSALFKLLGIIVVICCAYLLTKQNKLIVPDNLK